MLRSAKCPRESAKRGVLTRITEQCFRRSAGIWAGQPTLETESGVRVDSPPQPSDLRKYAGQRREHSRKVPVRARIAHSTDPIQAEDASQPPDLQKRCNRPSAVHRFNGHRGRRQSRRLRVTRSIPRRPLQLESRTGDPAHDMQPASSACQSLTDGELMPSTGLAWSLKATGEPADDGVPETRAGTTPCASRGRRLESARCRAPRRDIPRASREGALTARALPSRRAR
jgi:hypothetical protein